MVPHVLRAGRFAGRDHSRTRSSSSPTASPRRTASSTVGWAACFPPPRHFPVPAGSPRTAATTARSDSTGPTTTPRSGVPPTTRRLVGVGVGPGIGTLTGTITSGTTSEWMPAPRVAYSQDRRRADDVHVPAVRVHLLSVDADVRGAEAPSTNSRIRTRGNGARRPRSGRGPTRPSCSSTPTARSAGRTSTGSTQRLGELDKALYHASNTNPTELTDGSGAIRRAAGWP